MRTLVLLAAVPVVGCFGPGRPDSKWADQIDAAERVPNPSSRANTVGTLAQSAAYDGDPAAVRYALDRLDPGPKSDQVIAACVAQLAHNDKAEAKKIAGRIGDEKLRTEVRAKLDK
jgi:hypothetical protein